mgnify:CR=1 FL=1
MTKRDRELMVEGVLKRWRKIQEEVQMVEDDAANMAFSQGSGEPVQSSSISDKTARGAFLLDTVSEKQAWIACVNESMKWLESEHPELRKLLYGHYGMWNKQGYKRSTARAFASYFCGEHFVSRTRYHIMRTDALDEVVFTATEMGLFNSGLNRK